MGHDLSLVAVAGILVAVAVGAIVQGSIGFGFSLVAAPALVLVEPQAVPVALLILALPMTAFMAARERAHIDVRGFVSITGGRLIGTVAGIWVILAVSADWVSVLLGGLILAAVALSAGGLGIEPTGTTTLGAGIVSGVMSTTAAVGGPALAVVYQARPGPELRSTLALSYLVGIMMSLAALLLAGKVEAWHARLALELLPGLLLGLWVSGRVARYLDRRWLRPAVLVFAAGAGSLIVVRGLA